MSEFKKVFDKAMDSIREFWSPELTDKLYSNKEMLDKVEEAEYIINQNWDVDMKKFREGLVMFYKTHKKVADAIHEGRK